jgi:hypothetical protein
MDRDGKLRTANGMKGVTLSHNKHNSAPVKGSHGVRSVNGVDGYANGIIAS